MSESNGHIVIGDKSYPAQIETKLAPFIDSVRSLLRYVPKEPITIEGELNANISLWWLYLFMPSPEIQEVQGVDCDGNLRKCWQYTFSCSGPASMIKTLGRDQYGNQYAEYLHIPRHSTKPRKRPERMSRKWRIRRAQSEQGKRQLFPSLAGPIRINHL